MANAILVARTPRATAGEAYRAPPRHTHALAITLLCAGLTCTGLCFGPAAEASGLALRDTDPVTTGNAYVGGVSRANDATTAYLNPAGMAWLDHSEIETTVTMIDPGDHIHNAFGTDAAGTPVIGNTSGKAVFTGATGGAFGVFVLNDRIRVGYSFTTPYALRASYPSLWVGRYNSLVTNITDYNLSLAASYKVNDHLSIGLGPQINFLQARFTQAIDLGALTADPLNETIGAINGNGFGFGYDVGLSYRFDDRTQIGINYRSRTTQNYSAKQEISSSQELLSIPLIRQVFISQSGHVNSQITLPDSVTFGATHWLTPKLALMLEGSWTHWSLFDHFTFKSDAVPTTLQPLNWRNTWMGGIGAVYQLTPKLALRSGFSYDESPVTDKTRGSRTPDADRYMLAAGLSYRLTPKTMLSAAYGHIFTPGGRLDETTTSPVGPHTVTGRYSVQPNIVSIGVQSRF